MSYQPVIAHVDGETIRAIHGVSDLFNLPTVTIKACYGVPRAGPSNGTGNETNGDVTMSEAAASSADASRSEWLVGERLDKALREEGRGDEIEVRWPFEQTKGKQDWEGREFVLLHLYSLMGIKPSNNTHSLMLVPPAAPATLPLSELEQYTRMAFENLNTPALSILPTPLASLYAMNATTGVVLHIGRHTSEAVVVVDSIVRYETATSVDIGQADCEEWLEKLLLDDKALDKELLSVAGIESFAPGQKEKFVREIVEFIFAECTGEDIEIPVAKTGAKAAVVVATAEVQEEESFDVAKKLAADVTPQLPAGLSHKSKKQQAAALAAAQSKATAAAEAAAAADVIAVTIPSLPEKEIIVGGIRHRLAEPLLKGKTPGGETAWETIGRAVESASLNPWERMAIWDAVGIVGDMARITSFPVSLVTYLAPFLLTSTELPSEAQAARVRLLSIPDYIANFKGQPSDVAPFLGASMVAKVAFQESAGKHSVSKVDYNSHGPACIHGVWQDA